MDTIKRITTFFFEKSVNVSGPDILQSSLENIEGIFKECNGLLSEAGMPECSYAFQEGAISEMTGNLETLLLYVETANDHVWEELDHPLYMDFKNNATETLSRIVLEEISTENTFGMEEHMQVSGHGYIGVSKRVKSELKFSDFLGITNIEPEDGYPVLENVETMGEFASLFRADYDRMKPEGTDLNTFLKNYVSYGEYDHKAYHPVGDFFSGLLDITVIKPIIECITGTDLITGEDLTEGEKSMKLAGAVIDLFTFGQALALTKGAKLGAKMAGKVVAVELLSNTAAYAAGCAGNAMGLPLPAIWMLSVLTGCSVSKVSGKYIYKDVDGLIHELTEEEVERLIKNQREIYSKNNYEGLLDQRNVSNALEDVAGAEKPYAASRPTYGKGQAEQVWKNVKDPVTGKVYALSGVEITKDPTKPGKYLCRDVDGLVHELTEEEVERLIKNQEIEINRVSYEELLNQRNVGSGGEGGYSEDIIQYEKLKSQYAADEIYNAERIGSALKDDSSHRAASYLSKEQLADGRTYSFTGGDNKSYTLLQTKGQLDGVNGIFEYIINDAGQVTHQRFIKDGIYTGFPNQVVPEGGY